MAPKIMSDKRRFCRRLLRQIPSAAALATSAWLLAPYAATTQPQSSYLGRPVVPNQVIVKVRSSAGTPARRSLGAPALMQMTAEAGITSVQPLGSGSTFLARSQKQGVSELIKAL